jgi:hypothetical protein
MVALPTVLSRCTTRLRHSFAHGLCRLPFIRKAFLWFKYTNSSDNHPACVHIHCSSTRTSDTNSPQLLWSRGLWLLLRRYRTSTTSWFSRGVSMEKLKPLLGSATSISSPQPPDRIISAPFLSFLPKDQGIKSYVSIDMLPLSVHAELTRCFIADIHSSPRKSKVFARVIRNASTFIDRPF